MFLILVASDIAKRNAEIPSASAIAEEVAKRLPNNQNHGFMQNAGDPLFGVPRLIAGKPIPINIGVYNGGGDPIYNVNTLFLAILAPIKDVKFDPDKETYSWFVKDSEVHAQKLEKAHSDGNAAPPKYEIWTTLQVGPLADGDIDKILRGEMRLYLLSWARWKDEPQDYVNCVWMQPPATTKLSDLVWHICSH
jgi:hypothetical protein